MYCNKTYWITLTTLVSIIYIIGALTPYYSDDWHFGFMVGEYRNIESFQDVLVSNYHHYIESNGRVVCHVFLMTFAGLFGKTAFNIFNAFLFAAFLHLLVLNFSPSKDNRTKILAISSLLICSIMCGFKYTFLWMSGVMNYEFVAVLVLLFYYLLNKDFSSKWVYPFLALYGVIVGLTNEAVLVGFCLGCFVVYIRQIKTLTEAQWSLLLGLAVGTCFCVFSPGSVHRALGNGNEETISFSMTYFFKNWMSSIFYMNNLRLFWIMLAGLVLTHKYKTIWLVAAFSSFVFVSLTGFHNENSRFGIEFFSLILILNMIPYDRITHKMTLGITICVLVHLLISLPWCFENYNEMKNVEKQILITKDGLIRTNETKAPMWVKRFVLPFTFAEEDDYYCCFNSKSSDCQNIKRFYHCRTDLTFLPEKFIIDAITDHISHTCDVSADYPFYSCKIKKGMHIKEVLQHYNPSKWAQYPLLNKLAQFNTNNIKIDKVYSVNIENNRYLIIPKNPVLAERIKSIELIPSINEK